MDALSPLELAFIAIALLVVVAIIVGIAGGRRRAKLRARYGPEYRRAVIRSGSTSRAEADLIARERRVSALTLQPLTLIQRENFIAAWRSIQAKFVDDPAGAVAHGDVLLSEVMVARGYPMTDFDHRAEDLSVDHPDVVQNYRAGHDIARRHAQGRGTTEDLRQAMIHYRALFDELVNEPGAAPVDIPQPRTFRERL